MPRLSFLPTLIREVFGKPSFQRQPEPDLLMEDADQVAAYAEAGRVDGVMAAAYLFHSARISLLLQGCHTVVDLGCGPGTQLAQVAELNPSVSFLGVDLSEEMLTSAERHVAALGLTNVRFERADITDLSRFHARKADGLIGTMALHHLPDLRALRRCFLEVRRLLQPGGALYLADFGRLKSMKSVLFFASMYPTSPLFASDYERSLRAAFSLEDLRRCAAEALPEHVRVYTTFKVPLLVLVKSADRELPGPLRQRLRAMRAALGREHRRDLDDLRLFFRLGGLRHDPFRG